MLNIKALSVFLFFSLVTFCSAPLPVFEFGSDFILTDQNGKEFKLSDHTEKNKLMFFGYLSCPDFCPVTMAKISGVLKSMNSGEDFQIIYISVDPERDTAEKLQAYTAAFNGNIVALTGKIDNIQKIAQDYKAAFQKAESGSALGYTIDHTTRVYLLDKQNRVRHLFRYPDSPEIYRDVLGRL